MDKTPLQKFADRHFHKLPWTCAAVSLAFFAAAYVAAPPEGYQNAPDFSQRVRALKEEFKEPCIKELTGETVHQSLAECIEVRATDRAKFELHGATEDFLFLAGVSALVQAIGLGWIQRGRKQVPKP